MRKLGESFKYAIEGIVYALIHESNMRIHFTAALVVMICSLLFGVNRWEALLLFVAIALVIIAELFNTAIEALVDIATESYHPLAKVAKDVAAGAVFLTAGLALIVGGVVFVPYVLTMMQSLFLDKWFDPSTGSVFILGLVMFTTIILKAVFNRYPKLSPSLTTSLVMSILVLVWWMAWQPIVTVLVTVLSGLFIISRVRYSALLPVIWGALIGVIVTWAGIMLI